MSPAHAVARFALIAALLWAMLSRPVEPARCRCRRRRGGRRPRRPEGRQERDSLDARLHAVPRGPGALPRRGFRGGPAGDRADRRPARGAATGGHASRGIPRGRGDAVPGGLPAGGAREGAPPGGDGTRRVAGAAPAFPPVPAVGRRHRGGRGDGDPAGGGGGVPEGTESRDGSGEDPRAAISLRFGGARGRRAREAAGRAARRRGRRRPFRRGGRPRVLPPRRTPAGNSGRGVRPSGGRCQRAGSRGRRDEPVPGHAEGSGPGADAGAAKRRGSGSRSSRPGGRRRSAGGWRRRPRGRR